MIGFLFGLAVGTAIGFLLGCIAAIGAKTGREADEMFKGRPTTTIHIGDLKPGEEVSIPVSFVPRSAAGVRVCSCIGGGRWGASDWNPYYRDPDCPFHGGAA